MNNPFNIIAIIIMFSLTVLIQGEETDSTDPVIPVNVDYFQKQGTVKKPVEKIRFFKKRTGFKNIICSEPVSRSSCFWATPFAVFYHNGREDLEIFNYSSKRENLIYGLYFLKRKLFIVTNANGVFYYNLSVVGKMKVHR